MKNKKVISWTLILICIFTFNISHVVAYAEVKSKSQVDSESDLEKKISEDSKKRDFEEKLEPKIVRELVDKRTANTKQFLKEDMTIEAITYDEAVHYKDGDEWQEIDNDLDVINEEGIKTSEKSIGQSLIDVFKSHDEEYINTNNKLKVRFAKKAKENGLGTLTIDDYKLKWGLEGANKVKGQDTFDEGKSKKQEEEDAEKIAEDEVKDIKYKDLTDEQKKKVKDNTVYNEKIKNVKNNKRSVLYKDIKEGVDLNYVVKGTSIKEDIILKKYKENFDFKFNLDTEGLKVNQNGNEIVFTDKESDKEIFKMLAPNMVDSKGEYSEDIKVSLSEDGTELEVAPNDEWLKDSDRKYPVTIDPPIVSTSIDSKDIKETFAIQNDINDKSTNQYLRVGVIKGNLARSYIKFDNLPKLSSSDIVVNARLYLLREPGQGLYDTLPVDVCKVTQDWKPFGLNWNNQPKCEDRVIDTNRNGDGNWHEWNITSAVKDWYSTGENYGLMLKRSDEWSGNTCYWSSDVSNVYSYARPSASIEYRNFNGIEDYWSIHSQSVGRAGAISVNDYTGNLVVDHNDFDSTGNRMPISISHVYNTNDNYTNDDYGNGWRLSVKRTVFWNGTDSSGYKYYKYTDDDGTVHYFRSESSTSEVYKDMDGLDLTLKRTTDEITITDKKECKQIFDARGFIIRDEDNNGNKISYTYDGYTITKITDGVGRTYTLTYKMEDGLKLLDKLREDATGREITYTYQYGYLIGITYSDKNPDGTNIKTQYVYNKHQRLEKVINYDGYAAKIDYYDQEPRRVKSVNEFANNVQGNSLNYEYSYNKTKVIDEKGRDNIIHFNDWGHPVGVQDEEGRASLQKFITTGNNKNKLSLESNLQIVSNNLIKNHNLEVNADWSTLKENGGDGTSIYSDEDKYGGNRCLKTTSASENGIISENQDVIITTGKTYTLSAYARSQDVIGNGEVEIAVIYGDGTGKSKVSSAKVEKNGQWNRYNITFDVPKEAPNTLKVSLRVNGVKGTGYFDCIQLEEGSIETRYNYVENADFDYSNNGQPYLWRAATDTSSGDGYKVVDNRNVFYVTGERSKAKQISQWVDVGGKKGDNLVVGGWAKGATIETDDNLKRQFAIYVGVIDNNNNVNQYQLIKYNPDYSDWQYTSDVVIPNCDYKGLMVYFIYWNNANEVSLDNVQVYKEEYGTSYIYDDKGNVVSVKDSDKKKAGNEFNAKNDLIKEINPKGNDFKYEYDNNHNITKSTSAENVVSTFKYDQYGNPISVSSGDNNANIESKAEYTSDGNYTKTIIDETGNTTSYAYDEKIGKLNSVTDSNGSSLNYDYDKDYKLTSISKKVGDKNYTNNYEYKNGKVSKLTRNGFSYETEFDGYGNNISGKIAGTNMYTNEYEKGNGNLLSSSYNNGEKEAFEYDKYDKLTKDSKYSKDKLLGSTSYTYDKEGTLVSEKDSFSNIETKYKYDIIGRIAEKNTSDGKTTKYEYDENNNSRSKMYTFGKENNTLLSNGKTVKSSSNQSADFVATNVNDGKNSTRWASEPGKDPQWIEIDLGSSQNIKRVVLNWESAYSSKYDIQVSDNENDWTNIYSNEYGKGQIEDINGLNTNARYIRLYSRERVNASFGISLYEFQVYDNNSMGESYSYDKDDRVTNIYTTDGLKVNLKYDNVGRLVSYKNSIGKTQFDNSFEYEDIGKKTVDGKDVNYTTVRVKKIKSGDKEINYTYDKLGGIDTITSEGKTIKYYYDELNQLVREDNGEQNVTITYTYDEGNNLVEKKIYDYTKDSLERVLPKNTIKYEYDIAWKDKLTNYNGKSISYDTLGNPIKIGDDTLTWERVDLLTSYTKGKDKMSYKYDGDGVRTEKNVNGVIIKYTLEGDDVYYEEVTNGDKIDKIYYSYDTKGNVISIKVNDFVYIYSKNQQGDIIGLIDASTGKEVVTYKYDSWGKVIDIKDLTEGKIGDKNPYRYRGYRYDNETGLYYLKNRYYNPEMGRFINADDMKEGMDQETGFSNKNLYAYCDNNPICKVDSDGRWVNILIGGIIGAACGGASYLVSSILTGQGMSLKGALVSAGTGAVSGALAASGIGIVGQVIGNGIISGANYVGSAKATRDTWSWKGLAFNVGVGMWSGKIGGSGFKTGSMRGDYKTFTKNIKRSIKSKFTKNKKIFNKNNNVKRNIIQNRKRVYSAFKGSVKHTYKATRFSTGANIGYYWTRKGYNYYRGR